jgi:multiple antibiotic resistance protein
VTLDTTGTARLVDALLAMLVVANLLPILPVVLDLVSPLPKQRRRRAALSALLVGNLVALAFAIGGGVFLGAMNSEIDDLRVAGGIILLVFAVHDLLFSREDRKKPLGEIVEEDASRNALPTLSIGVVPLGVPLMVGPATLTTALVVAETYGLTSLVLALGLNALVNVGLIAAGQRVMDFAGHGAMRATGKVFGLLLASLAVTMIRVGVSNMWSGA